MSFASHRFPKKYFAKRCWDIALTGLISAIIVYAINPLSFVGNWLLIISKGSPFLGFPIIILLLSGVFIFARKIGFLYRRFFFLACPHPIASIFVALIFYFLLNNIPDLLTSIYLILIILASVITYRLNSFFNSDATDEGATPETRIFPTSDLNILSADKSIVENWLQKEGPIDSFETDFFGAKPYASRIQNHIVSKRKGFIGIIGSKGIGKSSVIALLGKMLNPIADTITLTISLWGCNSTNIAKYILEKMVSSIEQEIFCLEFKNLPENFSKFVNPTVGNSIGLIQEMFSLKKDALQEIIELDKMLQLFSVKLIVCVEDVDRLNPESTIPKDLAFLLDSLQSSKNIVFIVSLVHSAQNAQVITRVLDYLEWMPHLSANSNTMAIIKETVFRLLDDEKHSIIGPNDNSICARLGLVEGSELEMTRYLDLGFNKKITSSPIEAIVSLIKTPRNLKSLLREIDRIFSSLKGEIDFCDMFVACAIRNIQPTIFFLIVDRIDQFRFISTNFNNNNATQEKAQEELKNNVKSSISSIEFHEMELLIGFLFPGFSQSSNSTSYLTFQRLFSDSPTDYFKRFIVGELSEGEQSDQSLLKAIGNISNEETNLNSTNELIKLITENNLIARKIEEFKDFFKPQSFYHFCSNFFSYLLENFNKTYLRDVSGFTELWRISFSMKNDDRQNWLLKELEKAIQISLGAANDLYYYWRIESHHQANRSNPTPELRESFVELGKRYLDEISLCKVLCENGPFALYHFAVLYSDTSFGGNGFKSEEWAWLGNKLVIAAKQKPEILLPQISIFLAQREKIFPEETYIFSDQHHGMFGEDFSEVLAMFKTFTIPDTFNKEAEHFLRAVINHVNND